MFSKFAYVFLILLSALSSSLSSSAEIGTAATVITGKLERLAVPAACGVCQSDLYIVDESRNYSIGIEGSDVSLYTNNNLRVFLNFTPANPPLAGNYRFTGYYVETTGQCGQGSCLKIHIQSMSALSFEDKVAMIFNKVEALFPEFFYPRTSTGNTTTGLIREYSNPYQTAVWIGRDNRVMYRYYGIWYYFGTLEQANAAFCNSVCWE